MTSFPFPEEKIIKLGMIGCSEGNGHPYSWSAIFNGYERKKMTEECPFSGIPQYLNKEPDESFGVAGAKVTHISCEGDGGFTAEHVAACTLVPNVVSNPADMIGEVDAVVIATDRGSEHVERARPFIEAGLPIFVDKPMVDNEKDLAIFRKWLAEGHPIMSSSCMRYCKEFIPYRLSTRNLGELRLVTMSMVKSWEKYGIHALEGVYPILGPGFISARNIGGSKERNIVHLTHKSGVDVIVTVISDMLGAFGCMQLCGTVGYAETRFSDTFFSFKAQLVEFVKYLRTGVHPFPFDETVELMKIVIAGIRSREENGRVVDLSEIGG